MTTSVAYSETVPESLTRLVLSHLREIPDFPEPGVLFRDITPLLADGGAFTELVDGLADLYRGRIDAVAGLESRGFILAAPLAVRLGIGMITVRKGGKLPGPVIGVDYALEYGRASIEMSDDLRRGRACCSSTTSSPPAAHCARVSNCWPSSI